MDFSGHVDIKSPLRYRHPKVDQSVARLRALAQNRGTVALVMPQPGILDGKIVGERAQVD